MIHAHVSLLFVYPVTCKLYVGLKLCIEYLAQGIRHHRCFPNIWINEQKKLLPSINGDME